MAGPPSSCLESAVQIMTQETLSAQPRETLLTRGQTWLFFRQLSHPSNESESSKRFKRKARLDIALGAVVESSVSLKQSSQTLRSRPVSHFMEAPPHTQRLAFSVRIVEQFTITYSDFWVRFRSSALADEQPQIASEGLMREVAAKSALHVPAGQEWIMVEENRCYRVLSEWQDRIKRKAAWHTPLGAVISLASLLAVSEFKDLTWIQKGTLKGFFLFCFVGCVLWLLREIWRATQSGSSSIELFIADLKKGTTRHDSNSSAQGGHA